MLATTFFENVSRHKVEQRELGAGEKEENVLLEFKRRGLDSMFVACLWSHWEGEGEALDSFAAITDEPRPEVAAAGHDRCIIPIKEENIEAWLIPDPKDPASRCRQFLRIGRGHTMNIGWRWQHSDDRETP